MRTTIIAGLTRSGLTATMQMLNAGGVPCFGTYPAFENYKMGLIPWQEAQGKAVKVVDTHIQFPPTGDYQVIRLRRDLKQQAKSIVKFLRATGTPVQKSQTHRIQKSLPADYRKIDTWMSRQQKSIIIDFEKIIQSPYEVAEFLAEFLEMDLNIEKMSSVIKPRSPKCYDGLLEAEMV